jgi:DNA polymerase
MTACEKQNTARFLDLCVDFFSSGYRNEERDYQFFDDIETDTAELQAAEDYRTSPVSALERLAEEIRACRNCPLGNSRTNAAPGEGADNPVVLVIGEGPGVEEDAQGRPFVGKAGRLLDKMLESINLSRNENCFIANVIKCRPPFNRDPFPEETAVCAHFLERQTALLKPKYILAAGRIAAQTLLKTTESIGKLRGTFWDLTLGEMTIPLLVTYHPAALLRNEELKRPAWEDLKLLRSKLTREN